MSVMEEFGNNDIGCTSLNVIIPATSYMTCIPPYDNGEVVSLLIRLLGFEFASQVLE